MQVFCDRLDWPALAAVVVFERRVSRLYFRSATAGVVAAAAWLRKLRIVAFSAEPWSWQLASIRDGRGGSSVVAIEEDLLTITADTVERRCRSSVFLRALSDFDAAKTHLFLRKVMAADAVTAVRGLYAAIDRTPVADVLYLVPRAVWSTAFAHYASTRGARARAYRGALAAFAWHWAVQAVARRHRLRAEAAVAGPTRDAPAPRKRRPLPRRAIAALYSGKTATFDRTLRCDWFWLLEAPQLMSEAAIYFARTSPCATAEVVEELQRHSIGCVALNAAAAGSTDMALFQPGPVARRVKYEMLGRGMRAIGASLVRFQLPSAFDVIQLARFGLAFAYWHDFFVSSGTRVNVNLSDFADASVPMHLALERAGGVSLSFQWPNYEFSSLANASAADVFASFGPAYDPLWQRNGTAVHSVAYVGYITDHAFAGARDRSRALRERLSAAGARFVLLYLDENSDDSPESVIPNASARASYSWFLRRVIDDAGVGLVLKPGYPRTLRDRLGPELSALLDRAVATGRCVLMDRGIYVTEQYPAEAAMAADLSVALLLSGTAALESWLAGTPTVFLDLERCLHSSVYDWGRDVVVFTDFDQLNRGIQSFRSAARDAAPIGNLSRWVRPRDPFRDGRAALRLGRYVGWLHEELAKGSDRRKALDTAFSRHLALEGASAGRRWSHPLEEKRQTRTG